MFTTGNLARLCALLLLALTLVARPATAVHAAELTAAANGEPLDPAIARVWQRSDGPVADGSAARGWLWGPQAVATAVEHDAGSPQGQRVMAYFDKGRLDIRDSQSAPDGPWHVSSAALVREMLSGQIQFGDNVFVTRAAPDIAVVGDPGAGGLTYAALAPLASIAGRPLALGAQPPATTTRVGQSIRASVAPDGQLLPDDADEATVLVGAWDDVTQHNIAAPFAEWAAAQPLPATWLLGRPLTEPYWTDATVLGTPKRVLVQAFERRLLTYTPDNPPAWRVESGNAGQHYRAWRGLTQPEDAALLSLASGEPSGEELVAAATANGLDPYLLAAVAQSASHGDPLATLPNGGQGLLGVRPDAPEAAGGNLHDPAVNSVAGAKIIARLAAAAPQPLDWRAVLASYYSASPDWNDPNLAAFVNSALTIWGQLLAAHATPREHVEAVTETATPVDSGAGAYYAASYGVSWWERTLARYADWGGAVAGWAPDPNGYYCVHPGYMPGQRLRLVANGVTLDCTIGDTVASGDLSNWLSRWAIEMNYPAFMALGLNGHNHVEVYALGS